MAAEVRLHHAVLMRFMPACGAALTSVVGGIWLLAPDQVTGLMIARVLAELVGMTAGFAVALGLGRPRLRLVRRLEFRSVAAGFVAPLFAGLCSMLYPYATLPLIALLSAVAGAAALVPAAPQLLRFRVRLLSPSADPQGEF
jgi:hypothetical protein